MLDLKFLSHNILIPSTDSGGNKTLKKKPFVLSAIVLSSYFKYIPAHIVGELKSLSITYTSQKNRSAALYPIFFLYHRLNSVIL